MFESILANEMSAFLELRKLTVSEGRALHDASVLFALDRHLVECDYREKELTEEILDLWRQTLCGKSKTISEKVTSVRIFAKYLNEIGIPSFVPDSPKVKSDYIPYIYSEDELAAIFYYADNLDVQGTNCSPYLAAKIPMLLRILYGCGTRLGETLSLQRKDIDFKTHTLLLRKTKFAKERLIPVHETLINILEKYCLATGIMFSPDAYLFPGRSGKRPFTARHIATWFKEILKRANIDQGEKQLHERGACLHCFRHLFVLKAMQQLENAGHPVDMNDLLLPTYLGHESMLDTDKYMRISGAQLPDSLEAFESYAAGLIPQVEVPYEEE